LSKRRDIAFAIFKQETLSNQIVNQAINIGYLANRFQSNFQFISIRRDFRKSPRMIDLVNRGIDEHEKSTLIFNDWLSSTCIDFIQTDSEVLLILDGSIALGSNFESWLNQLLLELPISIEALSICPVESISAEIVKETNEPIKTSLRVNRLGFFFTREAAQKYIKIFDQSPSSDFTNLIHDSKISCGTLLEDSPNQLFYFLDYVFCEII
jgi:hypothetical protein